MVFTGCKVKKEIQYIDRISYVDRIKYDSIYVSKLDSIRIEKRHDTTFIEKYLTVWKNKISIQKDTIFKRDSVIFKQIETQKIEVPRKITLFEKFWIGFGKTSFIVLIIFLGLYIAKNYTKIKTYLQKLLQIIK